jgi:hypothetical protein
LYRIIIVNNGFRACKQHRTRVKVYRHPPPPTIAPEELYINENFSDLDSSITGTEIKCETGTDKRRVVLSVSSMKYTNTPNLSTYVVNKFI